MSSCRVNKHEKKYTVNFTGKSSSKRQNDLRRNEFRETQTRMNVFSYSTYKKTRVPLCLTVMVITADI